MPQAVYTPFNEDEMLKDADSGINELVEKYTDDIKSKLVGEIDSLKAVSYYTRCHGGNIHYIKVQTGPETFAHVTISMPFLSKKDPSVVDVICGKKKDDPIEAFGLAY